MHGGGTMVEKEIYDLMNDLVVDQVKVIQNQVEGAFELRKMIDQWGKQKVNFWLNTKIMRAIKKLADRRDNPSKRGYQICQEAGRVIITLIEGKPGCRYIYLACPGAQQGGFSVSGRCRY
jgi:hypothetical protein